MPTSGRSWIGTRPEYRPRKSDPGWKVGSRGSAWPSTSRRSCAGWPTGSRAAGPPGCGSTPARASRLWPLRGLGGPPEQLDINLGAAFECEQPVLLALDVGELRVAKALHGSRLHERLHHLSVAVQELVGAGHLRVAESARARQRDAAELAEDDGLAAILEARQVGRLLAGGGLERSIHC